MGAIGCGQGGSRLWGPEGIIECIKPSPDLPKLGLQDGCCLSGRPHLPAYKRHSNKRQIFEAPRYSPTQPLPLHDCSLALIWVLITFIWRFACLSMQPASGGTGPSLGLPGKHQVQGRQGNQEPRATLISQLISHAISTLSHIS